MDTSDQDPGVDETCGSPLHKRSRSDASAAGGLVARLLAGGEQIMQRSRLVNVEPLLDEPSEDSEEIAIGESRMFSFVSRGTDFKKVGELHNGTENEIEDDEDESLQDLSAELSKASIADISSIHEADATGGSTTNLHGGDGDDVADAYSEGGDLNMSVLSTSLDDLRLDRPHKKSGGLRTKQPCNPALGEEAWTNIKGMSNAKETTQTEIALSPASISAALRFQCPCYLSRPLGYRVSSCPARIGLTDVQTEHLRIATFSHSLVNGARKAHAVRLYKTCMDSPAVCDDADYPGRTRANIRYRIGGRQVCKETFLEV